MADPPLTSAEADLAKDVTAPRERGHGCPYCGALTFGARACRDHSDLPELDPPSSRLARTSTVIRRDP